MVAHDLSKKGFDVVVLEAENRIGGRIRSVVPPGFSNRVEAGAEFIHGNLPLTLQLVKDAGLQCVRTSGKMYQYKNGRLSQQFGQGKAWAEFYAELEKLEQDCSMLTFLETHFGTKQHSEFRKEVIEMAQGLDLADASELSVLSIRNEWLSEETQYRLVSGYTPLLDYLHNSPDLKKYELHLNNRVSKIKWQPGKVEVLTNESLYTADAVVIAISLGNLQRRQIKFEPEISKFESRFSQIGFGKVIKIALEFKHRFWEDAHADIGFLFTEIGMTFWTQLSVESTILTGWIGDGYVEKYDQHSDQEIINRALKELELVFKRADVHSVFRAGVVFRYTSDSVSGGGYSWLTTESISAIEQINEGISDTIWFCGEALHPRAEVGTVEAALQSGRHVARKIMARH